MPATNGAARPSVDDLADHLGKSPPDRAGERTMATTAIADFQPIAAQVLLGDGGPANLLILELPSAEGF